MDLRVIVDIETNSLIRPSKIWCIVCKEVESGKISIFREPLTNEQEKEKFLKYASKITQWIGHNILGYDYPVLRDLMGLRLSDPAGISLDTLIVSKLVDYSRLNGHSIEAYGEEFNLPKGKFNDWTKWSQEMEDYCVRDVEITHRLYSHLLRYSSDPAWQPSIRLEHSFQLVVNDLSHNGFYFNAGKATHLLSRVEVELKKLDDKILAAFPPKEVLVREFTPKLTKFGTISRTSVPRALHHEIHRYECGQTYKHTRLVPFNPSSHKQIIEVLNAAGWQPIDKTQSHIDHERGLRQSLRGTGEGSRSPSVQGDNLARLKITGWKVNENNLATLPETAPEPARLLAKRILLESRRRTLTEWAGLVSLEDGRIHGRFYGIGAWTHRMAHQRPNTANIPNDLDTQGKVKLLGKELRSLWTCPKKRLLVGVDAEGIQLRIFAHYIDDPEFTKALVEGRKDDKTDPHSLNQRILGSVCKSRAGAKRFIYALLLGAGLGKLSQILECDEQEAKSALDRLLERYAGFAYLKQTTIPRDGKRGWFKGLDGRKVQIPGDTEGQRKHLAMSGYLQNGEAVVMKQATLKWHDRLSDHKALLVNFVHDEWQTEVPNNMEIALHVAKVQADSLRIVGEELDLKCPLAGSYWNDDHKDFTIGTNWYQTH